MSDGITLRDVAPDDVAAVADVLKQATRLAYVFMPWTHTDESFGEFVAAMIPEWSSVRVAVAEGTVVGFACLHGDYLDQLFVAPAWQGKGIGSRLLDDTKRLQPLGFHLHTFEKNQAARRFYEARGLVACGHGFSEQEQEPDVMYRWGPDA